MVVDVAIVPIVDMSCAGLSCVVTKALEKEKTLQTQVHGVSEGSLWW